MELDPNDPFEAEMIAAVRLYRIKDRELREKTETLAAIHEASTPDHKVR